MLQVPSFLKSPKLLIPAIIILLVLSTISNFKCTMTSELLKKKDSTINEQSNKITDLSKTIQRLENTKKVRKEYYPDGKLHVEENTDTTMKEDINEIQKIVLQKEVEKYIVENTQLRKALEVKPRNPMWAAEIRAPFSSPTAIDSIAGKHYLLGILGVQVWPGVAYSFNDDSKWKVCAELKF